MCDNVSDYHISLIDALLGSDTVIFRIYGVTLCQTFLYYQLYQRDIIVFRIFVRTQRDSWTLLQPKLTFDHCVLGTNTCVGSAQNVAADEYLTPSVLVVPWRHSTLSLLLIVGKRLRI